VQPAAALFTKQIIPVEIARLELRGRTVASIHATFCSANAEAALGEIDGIAHAATDAVVGNPAEVTRIDATLQDEVFQQPSDFVLREGGEHARAHAKTSAQSAGHVVLAAALPGGELARGAHAGFSGVETEEDFTKGEQIVGGLRGHDVDPKHT